MQSDRTILLEVDHPAAERGRALVARFSELERSPEHIHTYRVTPLSLWNARAAGLSAAEILSGLRELSRYPVPSPVEVDITDQCARYGRLRIEAEGPELRLRSEEVALLEEIGRLRPVAALLGERLGPGEYRVHPFERGRLKQALIVAGWPAEDLAGYVDGAQLRMSLRDATPDGRRFRLRGYQVAAADSFWAAGGIGGGSGVLVLPCGAGKTLIGIDVMTRASMHTLILTTSIVAGRQWRDELLARTDLRAEQIGEYSGERKSVRPVTLATYQVLTHRRGGAPEDDIAEAYPHLTLMGAQEWGLIVYDEVHMLPAPVFRMTAEIQSKRRLGLTATLIREDGREGDVFSLIGPKRYDAPWRDLEAHGWIASATCTEVRMEMSPDDRMAYAVSEGSDRYRVAATNPRKLDVLRILCTRHRGDRVLVIGQYIEQLREIAGLLDAPLITGKTATREREKLYARFRDGDLRLLIVSKVANFAIDLPEANVAIQVSGTFGSRQEEAQRLGRILRPKAGGGPASFYTLVSRETKDQEYASHRQLFLTEQGYRYLIVDESEFVSNDGPEVRPRLRVITTEEAEDQSGGEQGSGR